MGCWGEKIFQSDAALDLIDGIISDAGLELYRFDNDTAVTTARDALDAGLLAMLVAKYGAEPSDIWDDPSHKIFLLVALAMQTGAAVDEELRASVKDLMPEIATPDEAKKQMRVALRVYKSGKRYIFDSPGLVATTRANMK
ncbi:hypothetical protein MMC17_006463 [Xylographa soralifera]|nr:hypothetical protein [Xylographa soralifera]